MTFDLQPFEWLNLFLRWAHVIAGIMWVGDSLYFMWLDKSLVKPEGSRESLVGEVWMVHGGGFYKVEKMHLGPGELPQKLHWFKWQAYSTWITGVFLLGVVYYLSSGGFLLDAQVSSISFVEAVCLGIGLLILAWAFYDQLFMRVLDRAGVWVPILGFVLVALVAYTLTHLISGRAAFMHIGAMLGTMMAGNVAMRIIPPQRKMVAASQSGEEVDRNLGVTAKRRSTHNSYMTFPLIFIMISNHYATTYSHPYSWVILMLFISFGVSLRHYTLVKNKWSKLVLLGSFVSLVALIGTTSVRPAPTPEPATAATPSLGAQSTGTITFQRVQAIILSRCIACHATNPADKTFGPNPGGVNFEMPENIKSLAQRIHLRVVTTRSMPFANRTQITENERAVIDAWYKQGASN